MTGPAGPGPVAGVDGCRTGWVVAVRPSAAAAGDHGAGPAWLAGLVDLRDGSDEPDGPWWVADGLAVAVVGRIGPVVEAVAAGRLAALAIDMPVGLPEDGPRACDRAARRALGVRRSSVFPAPVRPVLGAASYAEALARSRAASGRGLSRQAWNLVPKVAELDAAVRPALQDRVVEAHPEMAFARLAGAPLAHPKRTAGGRAERLALLRDAGLGDLSAVRLRGAAPDDVLDAAVLTLTAARVRDGTARRLTSPTTDARGLRMEVTT